MKRHRGFTYIELIVFIVVTGIIASSILLAATTTLRFSAFPQREIVATQTAAKCIEWFFGQRNMNGFSSVACGTTVPTFCNSGLPTGYSIATNVDCTVANYKTINVTVSGSGDAKLSIQLVDY